MGHYSRQNSKYILFACRNYSHGITIFFFIFLFFVSVFFTSFASCLMQSLYRKYMLSACTISGVKWYLACTVFIFSWVLPHTMQLFLISCKQRLPRILLIYLSVLFNRNQVSNSCRYDSFKALLFFHFQFQDTYSFTFFNRYILIWWHLHTCEKAFFGF